MEDFNRGTGPKEVEVGRGEALRGAPYRITRLDPVLGGARAPAEANLENALEGK